MPSLTLRYSISFIVLAIIIGCGVVVFEYQYLQQQSDSRTINIAGRQRMLSQRISKNALKINSGDMVEYPLDQLNESYEVFTASHLALRYGDPEIGVEPHYGPEIASQYERIEPLYQDIVRNTEIILAAAARNDSASITAATQEIINIEQDFLTQMNAIVFALDAESKTRLENARKIAHSVYGLLLIAIIIGWFAIIRPTVRRAQEVDQAKSEFVSLASHQLRTPLTSINWYVELLLEEKLSDEQKNLLEQVGDSSKRMVELVNALLNVSRIDLGKFAIKPEPLNLVQLGRSVADELKGQIDAKNLKLNIDLDSSLTAVPADEKLLRMVFQNLMSNAVKYTPDGGTVSVTLKKTPTNIALTVKDSGIGIPKKQQERIFGKLFRADNAQASETEGTGLGLYIVKSIIDTAGGQIWFESEENAGTTFFVELPPDGMQKHEGEKALT